MNRSFALLIGLLVAAVPAAHAAPATMSVQVREGQLRATPTFLGRPVASVNYGDRVSVEQTEGVWTKVTSPGGDTGWIHQSALTSKKVVMKASAEDVGAVASGEELALAGKGFNSDVEADFKSKNNIDFTWIDRMERIKVSQDEMAKFLKDGGVAP
jgi:uncharacterized protein YgiM (DUF1202 family)